jgi:predicted glycoside hydrolase/deacetylase ChbG (UPF0249 family)
LIDGKRLIVNADDFGFTPDVNEGIIEAHRNGILTSTTLMANGAAFEDAVSAAASNPSLDVGCHLVLVGGRSVLPPCQPLPSSVPQLLAAMAARQIRVFEELRAQVRKILSARIAATHLDTHKHTHLAPPVLEAVARIAQEFDIPWVRRPFDFPMTGARSAAPWLKRATSGGMQFLRNRFHRVLQQHNCLTTDYFAGFKLTGRFHTRELVDLIYALPEGLTEFMCHPGRCKADLRNARTRLKESRERELEALVARETKNAIAKCGVEVVNYRALSRDRAGRL